MKPSLCPSCERDDEDPDDPGACCWSWAATQLEARARRARIEAELYGEEMEDKVE